MQCESCQSRYHNTHICYKTKIEQQTVNNNKINQTNKVKNGGSKSRTPSSNHVSHPRAEDAIFPAQYVQVHDSALTALLMFDSGSNSLYITHDAVKRQ